MRRLAVLVLAVVLMGCYARHFVVEPEEVPQLDDREWRVSAEPAPGAEAEPAKPPPAP